MKFALIDGQRREAEPNLSAKCPGCEAPMLAKCGEKRIKHWAHRGKHNCDRWWENETEWHRTWKEQFPIDWQEVIQQSENGEKHIADVKTDKGWVIEFQSSFINPDERISRNNFYPNLVWVVNGMRRKGDFKKFSEVLNNEGVLITAGPKVPLVKLRGFWDESALLRDWVGSPVPIFFDFGDTSILWYLLPKNSDGLPYLLKFSRPQFLELFLNGDQKGKEIEFWFNELNKILLDYISGSKPKPQTQPLPVQLPEPWAFNRNPSVKYRRRRRQYISHPKN